MQMQTDGVSLFFTPDNECESQVLSVLQLALQNQCHTGLSPDGILARPECPRSSHWPAVRSAWLADHPTCAACGGTEFLQVHHIKPFHLHPELELDPINLITLCEKPSRNCHLTWGHFYNWAIFNPHVVEMVKAWSEARMAAHKAA